MSFYVVSEIFVPWCKSLNLFKTKNNWSLCMLTSISRLDSVGSYLYVVLNWFFHISGVFRELWTLLATLGNIVPLTVVKGMRMRMEDWSSICQEEKRTVIEFQRDVKSYLGFIIIDCLYTEPNLKCRLCQKESAKALPSF